MRLDSLLAPALVFGMILVAGVSAAAGLATTQRHYELESGLNVVEPVACRGDDGADACAEALTDRSFAKLLGAPVAAWGAAADMVVVVAVWLLVGGLLSRRHRLMSGALAGLAAMGAALLVGTVGWLFFGLVVLGVKCSLCLTLHGLHAVLLLLVGAALFRWRERLIRSLRKVTTWAFAAGAVALWVLVTFITSGSYLSSVGHAAETARPEQASFERAFRGACRVEGCPSELIRASAGQPDQHESLILADGDGSATLVEMVDLTCRACRAHHQRMAGFLRKVVASGRTGYRLVLYPRSPRCNPRVTGSGGGTDACSANAAMVCAFRHGQTERALDYLEWEFSATNGYWSTQDRRRWLEDHVEPAAGDCLGGELRLGREGTLALHTEYAAKLAAELAYSDASCRDGKGWWCFEATPSFAVFTDRRPTLSLAGDGLGRAGLIKRELYLRACVALQ